MIETSEVTCPTCFEVFSVLTPTQDEAPTEVDYDCEVCCRPMVVAFYVDEEFDAVVAEARGIHD